MFDDFITHPSVLPIFQGQVEWAKQELSCKPPPLPRNLNPGAKIAAENAAALAQLLEVFERMVLSFRCPFFLPTMQKTRNQYLTEGATQPKARRKGGVSEI
jgi:hypothetical protein